MYGLEIGAMQPAPPLSPERRADQTVRPVESYDAQELTQGLMKFIRREVVPSTLIHSKEDYLQSRWEGHGPPEWDETDDELEDEWSDTYDNINAVRGEFASQYVPADGMAMLEEAARNDGRVAALERVKQDFPDEVLYGKLEKPYFVQYMGDALLTKLDSCSMEERADVYKTLSGLDSSTGLNLDEIQSTARNIKGYLNNLYQDNPDIGQWTELSGQNAEPHLIEAERRRRLDYALEHFSDMPEPLHGAIEKSRAGKTLSQEELKRLQQSPDVVVSAFNMAHNYFGGASGDGFSGKHSPGGAYDVPAEVLGTPVKGKAREFFNSLDLGVQLTPVLDVMPATDGCDVPVGVTACCLRQGKMADKDPDFVHIKDVQADGSKNCVLLRGVEMYLDTSESACKVYPHHEMLNVVMTAGQLNVQADAAKRGRDLISRLPDSSNSNGFCSDNWRGAGLSDMLNGRRFLAARGGPSPVVHLESTTSISSFSELADVLKSVDDGYPEYSGFEEYADPGHWKLQEIHAEETAWETEHDEKKHIATVTWPGCKPDKCWGIGDVEGMLRQCFDKSGKLRDYAKGVKMTVPQDLTVAEQKRVYAGFTEAKHTSYTDEGFKSWQAKTFAKSVPVPKPSRPLPDTSDIERNAAAREQSHGDIGEG